MQLPYCNQWNVNQAQAIITEGINDLGNVDLADVIPISAHNNGTHYLFLDIDVIFKYLWVEPLFNKHHDTV